jgi:hypothetical protein
MPFDISKTVPMVKMTESGGIQRVVAKDPSDNDQMRLIRRHLMQEAEKFQRGDFSDPAKLHGDGLPGLRELQAGASRISISYTDEVLFANHGVNHKAKILGDGITAALPRNPAGILNSELEFAFSDPLSVLAINVFNFEVVWTLELFSVPPPVLDFTSAGGRNHTAGMGNFQIV